MSVRHVFCAGLLSTLPASASAQIGMDLMRPPTAERKVLVGDSLPTWVVLPSTARILGSAGVEMRPVRNSAVTHENIRIGVLVGALRNAGRCARNLTVRLQYTDEHWRPMGAPVENEARVSQVDPGGLLPYRFRLARRDAYPEPPSGYILQITEDDKPVARTIEWAATDAKPDTTPCPPPSLGFEPVVRQSRGTLNGFRVAGTLSLLRGGPVRADALMLTALLLDADGEVLEVLTGVPDLRKKRASDGVMVDGQSAPFSLSTQMPLGKAVKEIRIFTEALPDAQVGPP